MTQILSRYGVRRELGRGGMGVVYEAHDTRLDRTVAVKVLRQDRDAPESRERFRREAKAASALNHPNIITVHDIDSSGDVDFIVMEYVDGVPLSDVIAQGPLPLDQCVRYAASIASALAAAHTAGIVHRDLKPANVMIGAGDRIKVLDFGLSKVLAPASHVSDSTETSPPGTAPGVIAGTGGYMSPEQASGDPVDTRSDVFSFGVVLYEMLTGKRAFPGDSHLSSLRAVLSAEVAPLAETRPDTPPALTAVVHRCLEKDPSRRFASGREVLAALTPLTARSPGMSPRAWIRAHPVLSGALVVVALAAIAGSIVWLTRWQSERAIQSGIARVDQHIDAARFGSAYREARELLRRAPDDPRVVRALQRATVRRSIRTDPPGAALFYADFGGEAPAWERFGTTPIEDGPLPFGAIRWRIEKAGYETVEVRMLWWDGPPLRLHKAGTAPPGMVFVPAGRSPANMTIPDQAVPEFWLDKYEVTNGDFKRFVDAGGYADRTYWRHPFVKDGQPLTWDQAMALLRDRTGRPGPATWEIGAYPQGHAELPVTGVSWYEAAAFAEFSGKSLPTVTHWLRATGMANLRDDIPLGNFASTAPLAVSSVKDLGAFGTFGMSGNVKEWCLNSVEGQRYLLGGAWNEPIYMATVLDARPAFDRSDTNGIRLAKFDAPPADSLVGEIRALPRHITFPPPVSDAVFEAYRSFYAYDKTDLDPRLERTEESDHWRREIVSVATAYGRDRLPINLLLPKNASPPYQAVIYYPGAYAYSLPSSEDLPVSIYFDFIVRSGRAVIHPIYQNTYERRLPESRMQGRTRRDVIIDSAKDLGRTIDYLQTRADVDANKLGFHVLSTGPQILPAIAMEPRLKTAILLSAGFGQARARTAPPAEVDPVNFAPRITIPVLLLGGRYDFVLPLETSQKPLFALLGTPPADKHHSIFDAGHIPPRNLMIKETLDWLDKYLGPVKAR